MKNILITGLLLIGFMFTAATSNAQLSKTFTVVNKSGVTVKAVYVSAAGANEWGENISTLEKMKVNEGFQYGFESQGTNCNVDFKFVGDDGKEYFMRSFNLCDVSIIKLAMLK